ncbi:hypothetical protein BBP40_010187 [Aspergillus hancockii]|nr:hypothetical protein BBP40_010187 [Aspergillus hancockii]
MAIAVLSTGVAAHAAAADKSSSTSTTSTNTSGTSKAPSKTSEKATNKPTKNAAAGIAQNNPFAFLREFMMLHRGGELLLQRMFAAREQVGDKAGKVKME